VGKAGYPRGKAEKKKIVLAGIYTWTALYDKYVDWCKEQNSTPAKFAYFCGVRAQWYDELAVDRESDLPECRVCADLKEWIAQQPVHMEGIDAAKYLLRLHNELAGVDRKAFAQLLAQCAARPSDWLCFKADASNFPPLPLRPKNVGDESVEFALIGSHLVHEGYDRKALYLYAASAWPRAAGCDFWLSVMVEELRRYFGIVGNHRARILFVHTDNTVRTSRSSL
jgi:hypothetical protein